MFYSMNHPGAARSDGKDSNAMLAMPLARGNEGCPLPFRESKAEQARGDDCLLSVRENNAPF